MHCSLDTSGALQPGGTTQGGWKAPSTQHPAWRWQARARACARPSHQSCGSSQQRFSAAASARSIACRLPAPGTTCSPHPTPHIKATHNGAGLTGAYCVGPRPAKQRHSCAHGAVGASGEAVWRDAARCPSRPPHGLPACLPATHTHLVCQRGVHAERRHGEGRGAAARAARKVAVAQLTQQRGQQLAARRRHERRAHVKHLTHLRRNASPNAAPHVRAPTAARRQGPMPV